MTVEWHACCTVHVSSRSVGATLRTAIHLLLTYLLSYLHPSYSWVYCQWVRTRSTAGHFAHLYCFLGRDDSYASRRDVQAANVTYVMTGITSIIDELFEN